MLVLRCTAALLKKRRVSPSGEPTPVDATTLGEWYAKDIAVGRRRYVLFLNAASRAPLLVEASPAGSLLDRFRAHLASLLHTLCVPDDAVRREIEAAREVTFARTADRSVVGSMVQLAKDLATILRVREHRLAAPMDGIDVDLAFQVSGAIENGYPADVVRARFGLPRAGEFDLIEAPPGSIVVKRRPGHDWEFSFPRPTADMIETRLDALQRFEAGHDHEPELMLERAIRRHPEYIAALASLAYILEERQQRPRALELWRHAVALGERALPPEFRMERDRLPWGLTDNRPFLRARAGLAVALERAGQEDEADALYTGLLQLNPDDNQGIRQLLVDLRLRRGDDAGALEVCDAYPADISESIVFGRVLALYRMKRTDDARKALAAATGVLPLVAQEIARAAHIPPLLSDPNRVTVGGADQAFAYWGRTRGAWTGTPGAIEFVASFLAERGKQGKIARGGRTAGKVTPLRPPLAADPPMDEFLSDEQVKVLGEALRRVLLRSFPEAAELPTLRDPTTGLRLQQLAERVRQTREAAGLSVKDVAAKLGVPQYRVRAVEKASAGSIEGRALWKYCEFLGLRDFALRWVDANRETARKLGLEPPEAS